jgi:two-component system, sensor histidine kinase RegB
MIDSGPAHAIPLAWLVRLRWGSIVAQAVTVLVGVLASDAPVTTLAFVVVGLTVASNVALRVLGAPPRALRPSIVGAVLVVDTIALTALLFLCGGPKNPFSTLYLVYVTLAAVTLGMRWAAVLVAVSGAGYGLLFVSRGQADVMMQVHHNASAFSAHLQSMWLAFTVTASLIAYFVARVAAALRDRERELAEAQRVAARAEKLASLSTLAAGAAHELGSPLATIAVASKELEHALQRSPDLAEDARLIRGEVDRCQRILREMSGRSGEPMGEVPETVTLEHLVHEVQQRAGATSLPIQIDADVPARVVVPARGLVQSLESLVRNALDAGGRPDAVRLRVYRTDGCVRFEVEDHGEGISREILARIGEPFMTTKPAGTGMGLGLFLVGAFAQRWRGRLALDSEPGSGTKAVLELPLRTEEGVDAP